MVQVGYGYYGQCYELKRKKQSDLLPNYNNKLPSKLDITTIQSSNPAVAEIYMYNKEKSKSTINSKKKIKNR